MEREEPRILLKQTGWVMVTKSGDTGVGTDLRDIWELFWGLNNFEVYLSKLKGDISDH